MPFINAFNIIQICAYLKIYAFVFLIHIEYIHSIKLIHLRLFITLVDAKLFAFLHTIAFYSVSITIF